MGTSVSLGRIFGIPVGINWSVLVIATLIALLFGLGPMPREVAPGLPDGVYVLAGVVAAVLFLGSILAHELGHAVVARSRGVEVEGITLWLLGGVARLGGEAPSPRAELRIAAVGPLSSGLLAALFWALAWGASRLGVDPLAVEVLAWLALINGLLAAFNALPAAPLDGGRVLAAIWWWRTGNRTRGLVGASNAGRLLGGALLGFAGWQFLVGQGMVALWTAFIGWFIWQTAITEGRSAVARGSLAGLTAVEAAPPDPPIVDEWLTVDGLIAVLGDGGDHTAFVVRESDGILRSIVSLDDIRRVQPQHRGQVRLGDIAVPIAELTTAWDTEPLLAVFDRVPSDDRPEIVVYDSRMCLVGVISRADLARLIHQAGARRHPSPPPPPPRTQAPQPH